MIDSDKLYSELKQHLSDMSESTAHRLNRQLFDFAHDFTDAANLPHDHDVHKVITALNGVLNWIEEGRPNDESPAGGLVE